jgi:hypothetical protein
MEDLGTGSFALSTVASCDGLPRLMKSAVSALRDTPAVRDAVRSILDSALDDPVPATLPLPVRVAYQRIDAELDLGKDGEGAAPGDDRASFDPEAIYQTCLMEELAAFGGTSFGGLLAPLRVLTFWHMKRRALHVGAVGVATLLARLQDAAPAARFHLMGHSFGCIVVSAAVAGREPRAHRPIASLALVQGAMSLWSFSACQHWTAPADAGSQYTA